MKKSSLFAIVFVTAPNTRVARSLARAALRSRLAACANLMPRVESHYWWQGKMEKSAEALIIFKTPVSRLKDLEKLILREHPYDTPEFVILPLTGGNERYLDWLARETDQSVFEK